jgi:acyl-CoA thioester hydrolase
MARADFRLKHSLRVRWSEVDPQNIVFNPNYLMYFDVAAGEYWRELGFVYPEGLSKLGVDTFVVSAKIDFHRSAHYDDMLDVLARTARLGRTSLRMLLEVHRGDEHLISGELVYVFADPKTQKPQPIPDVFREKVAQFEILQPEQ